MVFYMVFQHSYFNIHMSYDYVYHYKSISHSDDSVYVHIKVGSGRPWTDDTSKRHIRF